MDRMKDNKATPSKETGSNDVGRDTNTHSGEDRASEYEQPNPSTATPAIPSEMPAREIR